MLFGILIEDKGNFTESFKLYWGILATLTNAYFFFDMFISFIVIGCKEVWRTKKVLWLEVVLQIIALKAIIIYWSLDFETTVEGIQLFNIICLYRSLRMLHFVAELE